MLKTQALTEAKHSRSLLVSIILYYESKVVLNPQDF